MIMAFFPVKKLRRNTKCVLFGVILLVGVVAVYHEMVAAKAWSNDSSTSPDGSSWRVAMFDERARRDQLQESAEDLVAWRSSFTPQTWKSEYKGQANLHVFEDWCGSSVADLRKNMHYPLYPHTRTSVQKLAVSPQWTNYGLRIFGYLHPYADGEFVFALSSDDNSEFWLSTDDSPLNVQLSAWVGKTGTEWTAPGEFTKFASQTSRPVWLSAHKRYFFEVIHKQNDRGTDHVEVAWQLLSHSLRFTVIESNHISLYVDESAFLMSDVAHVPQTAASHRYTPTKQPDVTADMQREDPRDTFYQVPLINSKFIRGVLPDCLYKPTYTIKDFPLLRYQGLQFVHMSSIYPNDYTRLTHMESQNSCFYPESPYYMRMFGFSRYMRLDRADTQEHSVRDSGFKSMNLAWDEEGNYDQQRETETRQDQIDSARFPDYGDDFDDYAQKRRRKLFSFVTKETNSTETKSTTDIKPELQTGRARGDVHQLESQKPVEPLRSVTSHVSQHHLQQNRAELTSEERLHKMDIKVTPSKIPSLKSAEKTVRPGQMNPTVPEDREHLQNVLSKQLGPKQGQIMRSPKKKKSLIQKPKGSKLEHLEKNVTVPKKNTRGKKETVPFRNKHLTTPRRGRSSAKLSEREADVRNHLRDKEIEMNMPLQQDSETSRLKIKTTGGRTEKKRSGLKREEFQAGQEENNPEEQKNKRVHLEGGRDSLEDFEDAEGEDLTPAPVFDTQVNWSQTFKVNHLDLQEHRSDWIDLQCNVSGNLLLSSREALPLVQVFMEQLNKKNPGRFTLVRVVNVVKRADSVQGSRYLLELELKDQKGQLLRLSRYIYALIRHRKHQSKNLGVQQPQHQQVLCNPVGFLWNPAATVHFIVPVKNQARWVQQLISDMEQLFRITGDTNFNLIIADYNSTDMDVRKALQSSSLPRYQYIKLSGNFKRSAGLQAGIDLINDNHSIVFLCDLHIHFPPSIINTIRKHCVEGYMAFAPIVLRLDCGATPLEARGYWEVNGFGLLGIYKSDLDAIGGMNTKEYTDRWGGEDWELLDRILQAGLEVERIYLRNFFHHYHSKRGMWNRQMTPRHT